MNNRAWTPAIGKGRYCSVCSNANTCQFCVKSGLQALHNLEDLAPEMAEAILEYEECDDDAEVAQKFIALAEKLRAIGIEK